MNNLGLEWFGYALRPSPKIGGDLFTSDLVRAVCEAGEKARLVDRNAEVKSGDGHRSIVTKADGISNEHILSSLTRYPDAQFLCEEGSSDSRVLSRDLPEGLFDADDAAVIDSLDGTTRFADKYPDWCVAGGSLRRGKVIGSAITAPEASGGTTCFSIEASSILDNGVFVSEEFGPPKRVKNISAGPVKASVILRGVDTELYANVTNLMPRIAASVRAIYTEGSGLFALMAVTLGHAAAVIQTPQKAWDWVPAYHALTSVGGVFRFFRLNDCDLMPVEHYDFDAFTYKKENRLGFVAGEPNMADTLLDLLPKTGWERHDPDTI